MTKFFTGENGKKRIFSRTGNKDIKKPAPFAERQAGYYMAFFVRILFFSDAAFRQSHIVCKGFFKVSFPAAGEGTEGLELFP